MGVEQRELLMAVNDIPRIVDVERHGLRRSRVAFHGSPNDSAKAFRNYESISVFYSWVDRREIQRVENEQSRFDLIWNNGDVNLRAYELPDAVKRNLIEFTARSERPYSPPQAGGIAGIRGDARWQHQRDAVSEFLKAKHGILEMATGTGKTRTALIIADELHERELIDTVVVAAYGTDLLDQWSKELVRRGPLPTFRAYERYHEAQSFLNDPHGATLLTSRQALADILPKFRAPIYNRALLICDEVHGMGSPALVTSLGGRLKPFAYTLGLSATPEREYDGDGNRFIEDEIGPVIFRFGLQQAIENGILCELDYVELQYEFSDQDRADIRQAIRRYHAKVRAGEASPIEALSRTLHASGNSPGKSFPRSASTLSSTLTALPQNCIANRASLGVLWHKVVSAYIVICH